MTPLKADSLPILSINHGTVTGRDEVASIWPTNTPEGVTGLWMASMGYYSCLPDYPGFGVSEILHPYVHAKSLAISIIDMIRAAKQYAEKSGISLAEQLFLTGYSEGGYATLATHKEIENSYSDEFRVTASAPIRFFHGDADKTVPHFNATHETAGLPCIFGMIEWFNQF